MLMKYKTSSFSFLTVLLVVVITLSAIKIVGALSTSAYEKARLRTARLSDDYADLNHDAINLFRFNTDQIHSDQLHFPNGLALEFQRKYNENFYNPIKLYMEYQGHDWDGQADDKHSLVFEDGSTVLADVSHNALRLRYYTGWQAHGKYIMLSGLVRELYIMPDGSRVWNNDGRICEFETTNGAWFFRGTTAYYSSDDGTLRSVDLPFDANGMRSWCALDNGVCTFAIYDGLGYVLWAFVDGECSEIYASPAQDTGSAPDEFRASNFANAKSEYQITYDLPDGHVTIDANGGIFWGK